MIVWTLPLIALSLSAFAQAVQLKPEFDAVSIKPSPEPAPGAGIRVGCTGGPGTKDPGLFTCTNMNLFNLVTQAYSMDFYRVAGLERTRQMFDVSARIPPGATKDEFRVMLQNMLFDRFHLAVHHESREISQYDLVIAKNGPKFKKAAETPPGNPDDAPKPPPGPNRLTTDAAGIPVFAPGRTGMVMTGKGARMFQPRMTMDRLAAQIGSQMGKPVTNATGLEGEYEIGLYWAPDSLSSNKPDAEPAETAPTLTQALQEQLGLRLEQKKGNVDFLVVDHVDKMPASN
jgi:uncharacterized protein (TIGR03435 family)